MKKYFSPYLIPGTINHMKYYLKRGKGLCSKGFCHSACNRENAQGISDNDRSAAKAIVHQDESVPPDEW